MNMQKAKPTLRSIAAEKKEENDVAFRITIETTADFVCTQYLGFNETKPKSHVDLVEAADLFEFYKRDGAPLKLTSRQTKMRNLLLEHAYNVLYTEGFSAGAGRLVLGRKGVAKTTTLMMVQAILGALLPSKYLIFFCSVAKYSDVVSPFKAAQVVRHKVDKTSVTWTTIQDVKDSLKTSGGKYLAFVDEFHVAYVTNTLWRLTAYSGGQQTDYGSFILTGSAPYLRSLAFGHAAKEDVEKMFPFYTTAPNLNHSRYTAIDMEPETSKESYTELAELFGLR